MSSLLVFDRNLLRQRRERAARRLGDADFLFRAGAERLADRLEDLTCDFPVALELCARGATLREAIGARGSIAHYFAADMSRAMAQRAAAARLVADEEFLPFAGGTLDLVLSNLAFHWINDLPGALLQIRQALKPDGLLLASLLGGATLDELRKVLVIAESEITRGASPRVSPFADIPDAGALLQRVGFALPVVDSDTLTVTYDDAFALMRDLRAMGETNALIERSRHVSRRDIFMRAVELYRERFARDDGRIHATFQIITMTAWAPSTTQQKPLAPGQAQARLADALGGTERSTGEKAQR
jgi:SAM-dependent methyltransferase